MERTGPWHTLVSQRPPGSLVSGHTLMSVSLQILASLAGQLTAVQYLEMQMQPWNVDPEPSLDHPHSDIVLNYVTTSVFTVSCCQYISVATVFSTGPPYRKPFYTNRLELETDLEILDLLPPLEICLRNFMCHSEFD